jgi:hypothetical protein
VLGSTGAVVGLVADVFSAAAVRSVERSSMATGASLPQGGLPAAVALLLAQALAPSAVLAGGTAAVAAASTHPAAIVPGGVQAAVDLSSLAIHAAGSQAAMDATKSTALGAATPTDATRRSAWDACGLSLGWDADQESSFMHEGGRWL